jgi:hypothetical protein
MLLSSVKSKFALPVSGLQIYVGKFPTPFNKRSIIETPVGPGLTSGTRRPEAACHLESRTPRAPV